MAMLFDLDPGSAEPPSANFPEPLVVHSTERRRVLAFDAATEEACAWARKMPRAASGTVTAIVTISAATATGAVGVAFGVAIEADTVDTDTLDTHTAAGYDTENVGTISSLPATTGIRKTVSFTLSTVDSWAAGDSVRIKLARKVANAADTAAGDIYVHSLEIRDAA